MAEDQIGPTSPGFNKLDHQDQLEAAATSDRDASRRIRPGTKSEDMREPPLVELFEIESAFQLTEYLKSLAASLTSPTRTTTVPLTRRTALELTAPPPSIDRGIWLYELCRLLVARTNTIITNLFSDTPPCSAQTCPEMRASEWQYLCAAHDPPKSCCAIDYCCHTLDWAATQLTSTKLFPSRLALGTENMTSTQQLRKMTEIFRRVYRIFAHAWFQHRDVFWRVEASTGLYVFFKTVCDEYRLIPEDNYTVPAEAEGEDDMSPKETQDHAPHRGEEGETTRVETSMPSHKDTQKRHTQRAMLERQNSVSTVIHEALEEEDEEADEELGYEDPLLRRGIVEEIESPPADDEGREGHPVAAAASTAGNGAAGLPLRLRNVETGPEMSPTRRAAGATSGGHDMEPDSGDADDEAVKPMASTDGDADIKTVERASSPWKASSEPDNPKGTAGVDSKPGAAAVDEDAGSTSQQAAEGEAAKGEAAEAEA